MLFGKQPYFGLKGGWLVFWITILCAVDMTLFGYDQVEAHHARLSGGDFG